MKEVAKLERYKAQAIEELKVTKTKERKEFLKGYIGGLRVGIMAIQANKGVRR